MKTYKTYAEAKLANPFSGIFISMGGDFATSDCVRNIKPCGIKEGWRKANPADYLMSMEEFLSDGYLLVRGDKYIGVTGIIEECFVPDYSNRPCPFNNDNRRFILSASCFGGASHPKPKPKTRTEHTKLKSVFELDRGEMNGGAYWEKSVIDGEFYPRENEGEAVDALTRGALYRRTETEIDPAEEVARWFLKNRPNKLSTQEWDIVCTANRETFMWIAKTALENGFKLPDAE